MILEEEKLEAVEAQNPVYAAATADLEKAEEEREKVRELPKAEEREENPKNPKMTVGAKKLMLDESLFEGTEEAENLDFEKLTPDEFDELYAKLDIKPEVEEIYNKYRSSDSNSAIYDYYEEVSEKFPTVEFYGFDWKESDDALAKYEELTEAGYEVTLDPSYEGTDAYGLIAIK